MGDSLIFSLITALVVVSSAASANTTTTSVNIAVILPTNDSFFFSVNRTLPALHLAISTVFSTGLLNRDAIQIELNSADSGCSGVLAPLAAFNAHKQADVFFGPCCDFSLAPVARYAPHWNIPVITTGALAKDFDQKFTGLAEYPTLTRVGANYGSLTNAIVTIIRTYNWNKVTVLYDTYGQHYIMDKSCHLFASALLQGFNKENITYDTYRFRQEKQSFKPRVFLPQEMGLDYAGMSEPFEIF